MIFVTVGTHEQAFDRLVQKVDLLKEKGLIKEDVIIQTGFSNYEPRFCKWEKLYPYTKMLEMVNEARIVITHGGPSSFIMPLQIGKIPIVVPRRKEFDEHVNDHQVEFCKAVEERQKNIIVLDDVEKLGDLLNNYDEVVAGMTNGLESNNKVFNDKLEAIVANMFDKK